MLNLWFDCELLSLSVTHNNYLQIFEGKYLPFTDENLALILLYNRF